MHSIDAGYFASFSAGGLGRSTRTPPQMSHRPARTLSAQDRQKLHSGEQIRASVDSGGGQHRGTCNWDDAEA